jgi:hypothetical protein
MKIGKIETTNVYDGQEFLGTDFTVPFLNEEGKVSTLSFRHAHWTTDLRGRVESVLHTLLKDTDPPAYVSNVAVK